MIRELDFSLFKSVDIEHGQAVQPKSREETQVLPYPEWLFHCHSDIATKIHFQVESIIISVIIYDLLIFK